MGNYLTYVVPSNSWKRSGAIPPCTLDHPTLSTVSHYETARTLLDASVQHPRNSRHTAFSYLELRKGIGLCCTDERRCRT